MLKMHILKTFVGEGIGVHHLGTKRVVVVAICEGFRIVEGHFKVH